ncbi:MAG: hypothetical protein A2234_03455 [Elusimicrobia bacterium RIFOXYA2_FULL_58_8]|nr:MAG: hypothetical protein A2285_05130 [Elusimicrobia bacterium RIFOXYA12_FULL_57_11]OGS17182.1 MAG: hypothetical protein A2234_03455 [Elusimicrobia bacterium RIFOXYA2_FULL_58_8]
MLIHLTRTISRQDRQELLRRVALLLPGARARSSAAGLTVTGFFPAKAADAVPLLENLPAVLNIELAVQELCPLATNAAARKSFSKPLDFSGGFIFIAGPCAVEGEASYLASAMALKAAGASALRAPLFKPRSSPYAFQGIGFAGLKIIARAKKISGLPLVTETTDPRQIARLAPVCDMLQIGARNMRNYELLKEAGRSGLPVLLKRAMRATLKEWLLSAEYLLKHGTRDLALCERGDSVFSADNTGLDFAIMRAAKKTTGLPVLADPSHSSRERTLAAALALKAAAAGADGLLIEASVDPRGARVDGRQTLTVEKFSKIVGAILCKKTK